MKVPVLAIFANCTFWFFLCVLPTIPFQVLFILIVQKTLLLPILFETIVMMAVLVVGTGVLIAVAPWWFRWYLIALSLMLGIKTVAENKQFLLKHSLETWEAKRRHALRIPDPRADQSGTAPNTPRKT